MIFKKQKPITPSLRNLIQLKYTNLSKKPFYKKLIKIKKKVAWEEQYRANYNVS